MRPALLRAANSVLAAVIVYPLFRSARAEHLMFTFPELVITTIGLLVLTGGYTGYRLSELIRFRSLAGAREGVVP